MTKSVLKKIFIFASIASFLWLKLSHIDFRFGDGNAYVYMAQEILNGRIPYRNFFLADPPVFVLFLTFLKLIIGKHLLLFQAAPIIIESATAFLIYLLLKKWNVRFAFLAPAVYLFSFSILSTSNFFTGIQFVVLMMVLALYSYESGKTALSGIFWSLACLSKLYAVPAFVGFLAYLIFRKKPVRRFIISFVSSSAIIMAPFLAMSFSNVADYTFFHHFRRPYGVSKINVFSLFISSQWPLLALGITGMFLKKARKILPAFVLSLAFILIFKDIYYLYLNILIPFAVISAFIFCEWILSKNGGRSALLAVLFIYVAFGAQSFMNYLDKFDDYGNFYSLKEITAYLKSVPDSYDLYGSHEIAPLTAMESRRKIFGNIIDTNTQVFAAKTLDVEKISESAVEKGIYLLTHDTVIPELRIDHTEYENFFSKSVFEKNCALIKRFSNPSKLEYANYIGLHLCAKSQSVVQ
ncbi:MAG: hypothetical protein AAB946_02845 [Patescibacteria group bacterium]